MSTQHADVQNSTAAADLGSYSVPFLGEDSTGARHYHDDEHDRVLVAADGDVIHVEDLDGRPVADWYAYVDRKRGWAFRADGVGVVGLLERALR